MLAVAYALLLLLGSAGLAADVAVTDGDTIVIGENTYRLDGIDAPESDQWCLNSRGETWACGLEAEERLKAFISGRSVSCEDKGPDRSNPNNKRRIGVCSVEGETVTLNAWLVQNGWALNFEPYAKDRFVPIQDEARENKRGMWAGCFVAPQDHRRWRKSESTLLGVCSDIVVKTARTILFPDNPAMPLGCPIKGKFVKRAWVTGHVGVYHLEGCRSYGRTKANARWFCTEEEARAANFRKALTC